MIRTIFPNLSRASGLIAAVSFAVALASVAPVATASFTLVAIPDCQNETQYAPAMLQSQVNWVLNNQASQNITFVAQEGDLTNDSSVGQFSTAHDILFGAGTTPGLSSANGVAWGTCDGDHDVMPPSGSANYNTYFGPANFTGKSWYGGSNHSGSSGFSSYQTFQADGRSYLVLDMEYHAAYPSAAELSWAQGIINAHPGMPTILNTHEYLNSDGTLLSGEGLGTTVNGTFHPGMWDGLVNINPQIFMVTCGHVDGATVDSGEATTIATDAAGKPVYELLANFQDINQGDGYMRLYQFDEANSAIHVKTYSAYDTATPYQTDAASRFDISTTFDAAGRPEGMTVPEPSTLVLAAIGAVALLGYGWRRRRSA